MMATTSLIGHALFCTPSLRSQSELESTTDTVNVVNQTAFLSTTHPVGVANQSVHLQ